MPRRLTVVILTLLLAGCTLFPEKRYVTGDTAFEPCPDFIIKDCTAEYPATIIDQGLTKKEADNVYKQVITECQGRTEAHNNAVRRCKKFKKSLP